MHIGGSGSARARRPVRGGFDTIRERLHLVPRYRQKLRVPRLEAGRPLWVDDPDFNLEYHVRQTALPKPGDEPQLMRLTSRIFSQQLDRAKPLWEMWLIEGLEGGGFAIVTKTHHALIDGISGVDLATVLFDLGPTPTEIPHPDEAWEPPQVRHGRGRWPRRRRGAAGCPGYARSTMTARSQSCARPAMPSRASRDRLGRAQPGAGDPAQRPTAHTGATRWCATS